jgi:hypothetical protein
MSSEWSIGAAREPCMEAERGGGSLRHRAARRRKCQLSTRRIATLIASTAFALLIGDTALASGVEHMFGPQPQSAPAWLAKQGFQFMIDAANPSRARFSLGERGLTIETLARAEPMLACGNIHVAQPAHLTVTWGVDRYPVGANWDKGVNNEAIMVMVQFGQEKLSGGLFLPPSPYFIGFFLCEAGRRDVPIAGRSYTKQGRYVCVDGPPPGRQVTSHIDLDKQFRRAFGFAPPPVTGFAIEADTTQVSSDGRASAWVKAIAIRTRP